MTVERDDLLELLDRLRRDNKDPRCGVFGPESMLWRINRESIAFLGGGRAARRSFHGREQGQVLGKFRERFGGVAALRALFQFRQHLFGAGGVKRAG